MKYLRYAVSCLLAVVALGLIAGGLWMLSPYPSERDSIERALRPDNQIAVSQKPYLVFRAIAGDSSRGLIFYPGGKTTADTYAPLLRELARAGLLVVAPPMPLNTPLLGSGAASKVMSEFPDVSRWYLAGHSLGGVAAARYAKHSHNRLSGLVLWAAYPAVDISSTPLAVLSVFARGDLRTTPAEIAANRWRLPASTTFEEIEGNHWQFGHFAKDLNQAVPGVTREQQQAATLAATLAFIGR